MSRRVWSGVLSGVLTLMTAGAVFGADFPLRDTVECTPRNGIPNFIEKLKAGKEVKIGYLGGSITAQGGWRVLSQKWFQQQYPKAKVQGIHAAIGGTGSSLGVFRVKRDVLDKKPDLLFVEFAVNDGGASPQSIQNCMEGIVRKTWKQLPDCDICFVYTITKRDIEHLQQGKMKRSASVMEGVADYYGIPSIHMGLEVAKLQKEGKLIMSAPAAKVERVSGKELDQASDLPKDDQGRIAFSKDGVHPYTNTGHVLYMQAIIRSMDKIIAAGKPGPHKLPAPEHKDNFEAAKMVPLGEATLEGPWQELDPKKDKMAKHFCSRMPGVYLGKPGAVLKFKFKGTKASIYDILGPSSGYVEVTVDGGKPKKVRRMDGYCTYHRLATLGVAGNMADKEHEVVIKVLDDPLDKSKVLFERNRKDLEKNPKKYEPTEWYAGAIFLVGDLVK